MMPLHHAVTSPIPDDQAVRIAQLAPYIARLHGGESPMAYALMWLLTWQGRPLELRQLADAWPQSAYHAAEAHLHSPLDFQEITGVLAALGWTLEAATIADITEKRRGCLLLAEMWEAKDQCWCLPPNDTPRALGTTSVGTITTENFIRTARAKDAVLLRIQPPGSTGQDEHLETYVQRSVGLRWFGSNLQPLRPLLWQISGLSALITFCALAAPLFVMLCYQQVIHPQRTDALPFLLAGAVIWLMGEALALRARRRVLAWASARLHHRISLSAVERLLSLPASATERAGVMAQLLRQKSLEAARDALCSPAFQLAMDAPFVLMLLGVMVAISGNLALVPLILAAL